VNPGPRRILALIPARGGSKRLPGKNIRPLAGLPLIAWTIRAALAAGAFADVLVSTDDQSIADVATEYGASVPWLRPDDLSTDTATSVDVVLHALAACAAASRPIDSVMLLQPTSPFRSVETISRAIDLHRRTGMAPVVSVCPAKPHPAWCFRVSGDGSLQSFAGDGGSLGRSQDLPPVFQLNGTVYLSTAADLRQDRSFLGPRTQALVVSAPEESVDIDDAWDWRVAECLARDSAR
jgi:CMP-N-acetylneuraminic acid synthetase